MNYSENMKRRRKHKRHKANIWPALKFAALALLGVVLFAFATKQARIERGYSAMGGEVLFLFLPLFYYPISKTVRDWLDDLRDKNKYQ